MCQKDTEIPELAAEERLQPREHDVVRAIDLPRPSRVLGGHVENVLAEIDRRRARHRGARDDRPRERRARARRRLAPNDVRQHTRGDVLNGEHPSILSV